MSIVSRRRMPAIAATTALVAALLPFSAGTATAATAQARATETGCPTDRMPSAGFGDTAGRFGEKAIDCVAWYGVAQGTSGGDYAPNAKVTRAAMAKFLVNLLNAAGVPLDPTPPDAFNDDNGTAFEKEINQLAQKGVVSGSDGKYFPQNPVSRAQMASFINEAHGAITGVKVSSADDFFSDDNGTFHEPNINAVASVGVASGTSETEFSGNQTVTRGSMALFLSREIDYLVELEFVEVPIEGAMDVILNSKEINQGRQVTGTIVTKGNVPVSSATVDICGVQQDAKMNVDNGAFSFTLPFAAPVGPCKLDFDVLLANSTREADDSATITVLETTRILDGPELVSTAIESVGADTVVIRYDFNEEINAAVEPAKFRLYGFAGDQFVASSATKTGEVSVQAVFTRAQYDDATTGGLERFAVQDLDGKSNAEYGIGLKTETLAAGETSFPDLTAIAGSGNSFTFTFDAPVFSVQPADFGAVYHVNGVTQTVAGTAIANGGEGSTTFTITFTPPEGGVALRGFIQANSIAAITDGETDNARQAQDIPGANQAVGPYLKGISLDQANNQVVFIFSEAVTSNAAGATACPPVIPGCTPSAGRGVTIYDINGDEVRSTSVANGAANSLVATFGNGAVSGLIAGASIDQGVAKAQRNNTLLNGVDGEGRENIFREGETAGPDLKGVKRLTDADGNLRFVYTFDQPVSLTQQLATGAFNIWAQDNTFKDLDSIGTCVVNGVEIVCTVKSEANEGNAGNFAFAASTKYAAANYGAVGNGGASPKYNPEGGFQL